MSTRKTKTTSERIASYLSRRKTPATASVVAERVAGKESTIKRTLSHMVQAGTVKREPVSVKPTTGRGRSASVGYILA